MGTSPLRSIKLALALWLALVAPVWGAAAFDAVAVLPQAGPFATSPQTVSITLIGTGANRQCTVWISTFDSGGGFPGVTAVTVGTDNMSLISGTTVTSGALKIEAWGGALTVEGGQTVTVTFTNGGVSNHIALFVISATGTDLINNGATLTDTASPAPLAMTSAAGDLTATSFLSNGTGASTDQTQKGDGSVVSPALVDIGPGTANPTHTWSDTGVPYTVAIVSGVNFQASGATPAATPTPPTRTLLGVGQ